MTALPLLVCVVALAATPAATRAAEEAPEAVRTAERALAQLGPAALGEAIAAQEAALAAMRATLRDVAERRVAAQTALQGRRRTALATLATLERIERAPPLAWFAHPGGPAAAARAAGMIAAAAPALSAEVARTHAELTALASARADGVAGQARLGAMLAALQTLREGLMRGEDDAASREQRILAQRQAESALAALAEAPRVGPPLSVASSSAPYPLPVSGDATLDISAMTLAVHAPAYALAHAPATVSLRFAGPGGGPGLTAILEPRAGVLLVLRGLDRVDRAVGDTLTAGEPLGALGGPPPASDEFLIDASIAGGTIPLATLYIDVMTDGERDSPAAWFALTNERTDG